MKNRFLNLILMSKIIYALVVAFLFIFLFGWIFIRFFFWLVSGGLILFALILAVFYAVKNILFSPVKQAEQILKNAGRKKGAIDVEAEVEDMENDADTQTLWQDSVYCPFCNSNDTRFISPHYEAALYECNRCRQRFEAENS
ncbi:MAG: hypothetical protein KKB82_03525 [Candidatus Omnitrophica bacterium]|nr:hypothetical protein [Candidatus Omnitrophota bacterium]